MLGFLFGFNARLGRLHYFLSGVALAIAMTLIGFAIASFAYQHTARGAEPAELLTWPVIGAGALLFWITSTLQSMRSLRRAEARAMSGLIEELSVKAESRIRH